MIISCEAVDSDISGWHYAGGIIGLNTVYDLEIVLCSVSNCRIDSEDLAGGITSYLGNDDGIIYSDVSGCTITAVDCGGIAGYTFYDSYIQFCKVTDSDIIGEETAGGITGYSENSQITNCTVSGGGIIGRWHVGGVVGHLVGDDSVISNCKISSDISGIESPDSQYLGGIAGYVFNSDMLISDCEYYGDITAGASSEGPAAGRYAGGIIALSDFSYFSIIRCVTYGSVNAGDSDNSYAGGILGCFIGDEDYFFEIDSSRFVDALPVKLLIVFNRWQE